MTTRDQIHKWLFYALGLFPIWVLDAFILNRIAPFGIIPMLLPLAVVAVAVLEGAYAGAGFGLAVGLLWELSYSGGFGGLVFGMTLAGLAVGTAAQYVLSQNFFSCLLCSAGVLAVLDWRVLLIILGVFLIVTAVSRYVSLGSVCAAVAYPVSTLILRLCEHSSAVWGDTIMAFLIAVIVIVMHRKNIERLFNGTENKIGQKKKQQPDT